MYGLETNNTGLRAIKDNTDVLTCTFSGYSGFIPEADPANAIDPYAQTWLSAYGAGDQFVIAYTEGCLHYIDRYYPDYKDPHITISSLENKRQDIYVFSRKKVLPSEMPDYGFAMWRDNGELSYHSNIKSMNILGYHLKNENKTKWIYEKPKQGTKIAFLQIGNDTEHYGGGSGSHGWWNEVTHSMIYHDSDYNIFTKRVMIERYKTDSGFPYPNFDRSKNNILYYIIDVTRIPINYYPPGAK